MAEDCTLPSDMTEICWGMFEDEAKEYNSSDATLRRQQIDNLGHYVAEDPEDALDKLLAHEDGNQSADDVVMMWEPLTGRYTVDELLNEQGL
ncbi:MAG: hypothetical protein ACPG5W_04435 [Flavobacteriales bacterium]